MRETRAVTPGRIFRSAWVDMCRPGPRHQQNIQQVGRARTAQVCVAEPQDRGVVMVISGAVVPTTGPRIRTELHHPERYGRARIGVSMTASADKYVDELSQALFTGSLFTSSGQFARLPIRLRRSRKTGQGGSLHKGSSRHFSRHANQLLFSSCGRSWLSLIINSPNSEFAQANHARVNFAGLSLSKDSCMNPVPACVVFSQSRHCRISPSSVLGSARVMIAIGQIMLSPS